MATYIALLRGINVSGHNIIKMELLRKVLGELDFKNISTYIQSGNIIFDSSIVDVTVLENQIAIKIEEHFGFLVPVRITTLGELETIDKQNPFASKTNTTSTQPYVVFLSKEPSIKQQQLLASHDFGLDEYTIQGKIMYVWYADSAGKTKLTNAIIEKKLLLNATSRNWKTIQKLRTLAKN